VKGLCVGNMWMEYVTGICEWNYVNEIMRREYVNGICDGKMWRVYVKGICEGNM